MNELSQSAQQAAAELCLVWQKLQSCKASHGHLQHLFLAVAVTLLLRLWLHKGCSSLTSLSYLFDSLLPSLICQGSSLSCLTAQGLLHLVLSPEYAHKSISRIL